MNRSNGASGGRFYKTALTAVRQLALANFITPLNKLHGSPHRTTPNNIHITHYVFLTMSLPVIISTYALFPNKWVTSPLQTEVKGIYMPQRMFTDQVQTRTKSSRPEVQLFTSRAMQVVRYLGGK